MTTMKNKILTHILRHAWFWPLEFWMRPLTVIDRFEKAKWLEFFAALVGSGLWGALIGTVLWFINGDIHTVWVMAVAGALAGAATTAGLTTLALVNCCKNQHKEFWNLMSMC